MLSDADPIYVAALILGVYARGLTTEFDSSGNVFGLVQRLLDNSCHDSSKRKSFHDANEMHPTILYARLHKIADFYQVETLRHTIAGSFAEALRSSDVTIENTIDALEVLYDFKLGYTIDDTLRALAVYIVQKMHHKVTQVSRFDELIRCYPEFAVDYATKYHRANWIYCPECKINVTLEECQCGFSGVCGYRYCTTQDFSKMRCTTCDRKGHMMKQAPVTDRDSEEEIECLKIIEVLDEEKLHKTPLSPSKKRKMKFASGF